MILKLVDYIFYSLFNLDSASKIVQVFHFFVYDTIKVVFLLFVMIVAISFLRTYLSEEKIKTSFNKKGISSYFYAAVFGSLTPFCSCSSIPIFFGFLKAGIPLGVMFSFLITSPLINEYLVVLMFGFFGIKITLAYIAVGILIGVVSGIILGKFNLEQYLSKDFQSKTNCCEVKVYAKKRERLIYGIEEAKKIVKKLILWIVAAVFLGSLIHNYVPEELIQEATSKTGVFSVPIVVILGVPMYGSCAAIVPIAVAFFEKGVPLGTALSFMMAVSALSLPQAVMLKRAMQNRLLILFFSITVLGIILIGYLFNFFQYYLI